jgi:hypothetical protein
LARTEEYNSKGILLTERKVLRSLVVLQNAYVLAAYGNGLIPPMPHHRQDLTRNSLCSRWSKML